jgi:fructose-1,6-bisphosphatase/inositol monophosphatase family enzyme
MDYVKELEFAKNMADAAGKVMRKYYRADQQVETKADHTPVTIADTEINQLVIDRVKREFPDHGLLGEEISWQADREKLWVCDPIDGTSGYVLHVPTSMFALTLVIDGRPVVAVAYNPWAGNLYYAVKNRGAFRDDSPIHVSARKWGSQTIRLAGSSGGNQKEPANKFSEKLAQANIYVTSYPGNVFKGCLIAEGSIEGRTFMYSGAHDVAAVKLIIEEAGGKVTDLDGNEQRYDQPINGAIMSNGLIHDELLKLVQASR